MKTIVLHGSPKRNGNSDTLAKYLTDGLRSKGHDDVIDFIVTEMNIGYCKGCMTCSKSVNHDCVIQDDMQQIYHAFKEADIVVFATPMFWGYMTAQLKTVMDRMEAIAVGPAKWWQGKKFVGIVTYWHHYESTIDFFKRVCPFFGVDFHSLIYCSKDDSIEGDVHVSTRQDKLDEAFNLGQKLAGLK